MATKRRAAGDRPRHHHYVPTFYLAGFTGDETGDGAFYVIDLQKKTQRRSTPKRTAHRHDFHRVDLGPTQDPMVIERKLAELEGEWSRVVNDLIRQPTLPCGEALCDLLAFVAFMAVRVPRIRDEVARFMDRVHKAELMAAVATPEGRAYFQNAANEHWQTLPASKRAKLRRLLPSAPDVNAMAQYISWGEFTVTVDKTWHVQNMIEMALTLLPVLGMRRWRLVVVADDAPDLICSSSPVCLTWSTAITSLYAPGFGLRNTLITLPINRRLMVESTFEDLPATMVLNRDHVAAMNSRTAMFADEVYSSTLDFVVQTSDGRTVGAQSLLS
jgi:hypothetical protein